ncbi:MAG: SH3 domain-containing protein, partial [Oscillospiraceae bacterium]
TDKAPIEVTLYSQALITPKIMGTVTGLDDFLNMRTEPLYSADEVHQLYNGDQVEILEEVTSDDGALWYKVLYNDSIMGYSSAEFIVKNSEIKNYDSSDDSSETGETEATDETESEE